MRRFAFCLLPLFALVLCLATGRAGDEPKGLKGTFATKFMNEKWSITFDGKTTFTVKRKKDLAVEGDYKIIKQQVHFTDKKGPLASPMANVGKYKWMLDGDKLTFTKIDDAEAGRAMALTAGPWLAQ